MDDCIFCKIIRKEIPSENIWEDEEFFAFMDIRPLNPGHMLVLPKKHVDYVFDLDEETYIGLFDRARNIFAEPLKEVTGARRIGMVVEGFGVAHVHLHLVPVNTGNELDPHRAYEASAEELKKYGNLMRSKLA
jgi:histidine triad (HIT) family protein